MPYQYRNPRHYRYTPEPTPRRRRSRRLSVLVAAVVVVGTVALSYIAVQIIQSNAAAEASTKKLQARKATVQQASATIRSLIAADVSDTIGVAIENVKTYTVTTFGSTEQFDAASTEKVLSAVTYYHLVEKGILSLEDSIGPYPASYQLQQMINQSNNDSWNAINDAVGGNDELQSYATSIGLQYKVDGNLISTKDMATLLTKLYAGKLLNADHTKTLLSYMQNTNNETLLPSVLPRGLTIYHKYGELSDGAINVLHDAAIVTDGTNTYALVIYSDGKTGQTARTETITRIARSVIAVCGW